MPAAWWALLLCKTSRTRSGFSRSLDAYARPKTRANNSRSCLLRGRKCLCQLRGRVDKDVRLGALQRMRCESVGDADAPEARVTRGQDVYLGIANHDGLFRLRVSLVH